MPSKLFAKKDENFHITVDYGVPIGKALELAESVLRWTAVDLNLNLEKRTFPLFSGIKKFTTYYAVLQHESCWLRGMRDVFREEDVVPADIWQFLAFLYLYGRTEVTPKNPSPIVAAAPGSTWLCSHDCLNEMIGVRWDTFYHAPGPSLGVESDPFRKGMRFLAIRA